jgi:hypothetical protein
MGIFPLGDPRRLLGDAINKARGLGTAKYGDAIPLAYGKPRLHSRTVYLGPVLGGWMVRVLALCEGPITGVTKAWKDKDLIYTPSVYDPAVGPTDAVAFGVIAGARPTQNAWIKLIQTEPAAAIRYPGLAYIAVPRYGLEPSLSEGHSWEVQALLHGTGGSAGDAHPASVIVDVLANASYGAAFPFTIVTDVGVDGNASSSYRRYTTAEGFWISPFWDSQSDALDCLRELLDATNGECLWSEGKLKILPLGDSSVTGNAVTYTPYATVQYALDADDFVVGDANEDPVSVERAPPADVYNKASVEFLERAPVSAATNPAIAYTPSTVDVEAPVHVSRFGARKAPVFQANAICLRDVATKIAKLRLQRHVNLRNTYRFRLPWRFCRLEPMDLVSLTDPLFGLVAKVVQITKVTIEWKDNAPELSIEAEDWLSGVASTVAHVTQSNESTHVLSPGDVPATRPASEAAVAQAAEDAAEALTTVGTANANASTAITLAGSKTRVFYQTTEPTNPIGGYTLCAGDIWFDTSTYVEGGVTKISYAASRWTGSAWVAAPGDGNLAKGPGMNILPNGDFSGVPVTTVDAITLRGWTKAANLMAPTWNVNLASWALGNNADVKNAQWLNTPYIFQSGRIDDVNAYAEFSSDLIPIDPAKRYIASAYTGAHRCKASIILLGYAADGTTVTGATDGVVLPEWSNDSEAAGGTTIAGYKRIYVTSETLPAGTHSVKVLLRKLDTNAGQTSSYMFFCRAQLEEVGPSATEPGTWVAPAKGIVTFSELAVGAVAADNIAGNVIRTPNYAFTGAEGTSTEVATAGAKMQNTAGGVALLVAPQNLKIGPTLIADTWFGHVRPAVLNAFRHVSSNNTWVWNLSEPALSTDWAMSYDTTFFRLIISLKGWAALGLNRIQLTGVTRSTDPTSYVDPLYSVTQYASSVAGNDLTCTVELRLADATAGTNNRVDWRVAGLDAQYFNLSFLAFTDSGWKW